MRFRSAVGFSKLEDKNLMKLSTRARYALHTMIAISRLGKGNHPVSLMKVSEVTTLSRRYLEQLVIDLKKASLLKGISGRSGGYLLASSARSIKIGRIIEAVIGPINIVECVQQPETCLKSEVCDCRCLYVLINHQIINVLNKFSLADLSNTKKLRMAQDMAQKLKLKNTFLE